LGKIIRDLMINQKKEKEDIVATVVNLNLNDVIIVQNVKDVY
jgi:hypothetical protein